MREIRRVDVINEKPDMRKKGLRMIIESIGLNENGEIEYLLVKRSTLHCEGEGYIFTSQNNRVKIYEEEAKK